MGPYPWRLRVKTCSSPILKSWARCCCAIGIAPRTFSFLERHACSHISDGLLRQEPNRWEGKFLWANVIVPFVVGIPRLVFLKARRATPRVAIAIRFFSADR